MKIVQWTTAIMLLIGVTACNTMEGLGEDVQAGGAKLEKSAEKRKND